MNRKGGYTLDNRKVAIIGAGYVGSSIAYVHLFIVIIGILYSSLFTSVLARLEANERYFYAYLFYGMYSVCSGLNVMKQAFAILLITHAYLSFRRDNKKTPILYCVLAISFQAGTIVPCAILLAYLFFCRDGKRVVLMKAVIVIGMVVAIFAFQWLLNLFGASVYATSQNSDFSFYNFVLIILILILWIVKKKHNKETFYNCVVAFNETIIIAAIISCIMGGIATAFIRFTLIFIPLLALSCTDCSFFKHSSNLEKYIKVLLALFCFFLFLHNLKANIGGVVPFEFYNI